MKTCSAQQALRWIESSTPPQTLCVSEHLVIQGLSIVSLPELEVRGDLVIQNCQQLKALPARIKVMGRLVIDACDALEVLDSDCTTHSSVIINSCAELYEIRVMPGDSNPGRKPPLGTYITLANCAKLQRLPARYVANVLIVNACDSLASLGSDVVVEDLHIHACPSLIRFPQTFVVGSLDLSNCPALAAELPTRLESVAIDTCPSLPPLRPNTTIAGSLSLRSSSLVSHLPQGLAVGNLYITGADIVTLPDDLKVGHKSEKISKSLNYGSVFIQDCPKFTSLPGSLGNRNELVLRNCPLFNSIPENFSVGTLGIHDCESFSHLPGNLKIAGPLRIENAPALRTLPANLKLIGSLTLRRCTTLTELPVGLEVKARENSNSNWSCLGLLVVFLGVCAGAGTAANAFPTVALTLVAAFFIWIFLAVTFASLRRKAPPSPTVVWARQAPESGPDARLRRGSAMWNFIGRWDNRLDLADCSGLTRLPDDLIVAGGIDIAGTGITSLPPSLKKTQLFWRGVSVTPRIAFSPQSLSVTEILDERNTELRRVMLERFPGGFERFMTRANAKTIDADTDPGGDRKLLRVAMPRDEDLVCLQVHCPSTGALYILRVPPSMATCRQAAAWVAGFDNPDDYQPVIET